ncbi:hypothetical protein Vretifemale_15848 [Volvox reticuliferus]|uniref:FAD/NAD(P)-binding domain-containing protein n=1 Tax=Volvox reticuliferus TaxID=1737510 RepID=A0A8J4CQD4_9CHLO|nr:hypothetical protein Vretifemale_15848 [Volvox reticuliferus]
MRVCVVGGGAGGVELAAAVRYRLEEERRRSGWSTDRASAAVSLLCRGDLLPGHPPHVRRLVRQLLAQRGVEVRSGDAVTGVRPRELLLHSGERVPYDECLWCTEASPAPWLSQTGLPTDPLGFLSINDKLQSDGGPPEVFASGDVATCSSSPRPKAGVFAVRQGPPLTHNLRAFLDEEPLRPFVPQTTALALISLGDRFCVASRTGVSGGSRPTRRRPGGRERARGGHSAGRRSDAVEEEGDEWLLGWILNGLGGLFINVTGPLLWRWKDTIDRAFMRRYGEDLQAST